MLKGYLEQKAGTPAQTRPSKKELELRAKRKAKRDKMLQAIIDELAKAKAEKAKADAK